MLERSERILKIICLGLAAFLLYELASAVLRHNPLEHMSIPTVPALAAVPDAKAGGLGTKLVITNGTGKTGTNSMSTEGLGKTGTNSTLISGPAMKGTNAPSSKSETNSVPAQEAGEKGTNSAPTQGLAKIETNTITPPGKEGTNVIAGTNLVAGTNAASGTNLVLRPGPGKRAVNLNARMRPGKPAAELSPVIQARVDKIVDSEILGPVIRPMPMGLLGIAGEYAFLRAPSGQTGLVKEGDELGEIKLLKIGINRVLVEEAGEKKELIIFEGYGSETLMPKPKDKPDEIITKTK